MEFPTIHSTAKGSDKLYQVTVVKVKGGYDVIYANGKRTSGLTAGKKPKNGTPLTLVEAEAMAIDTLNSKRTGSSGYHDLGGCSLCANEDGAVVAPVAPTMTLVAASTVRDFTPQLLTEIDGADTAARILLQPGIAMQQKFDGKRIRLLIEGRSVSAYNRDGIACGISTEIMRGRRPA